MRRILVANLVGAAWLLMAVGAAAQTLRPLQTEDVDTLESGHAELMLAFDVDSAFLSPTFPLSGRLLRAPIFTFAAGFGSRVEVQLFMPLLQKFNPDQADSRHSVGDLSLATKIRIFGGRGLGPGVGFRWKVKLPNASNEEGIGSDETDFLGELLAGFQVGGFKLHASLGLAILGNPGLGASQFDQLSYGLALERPFSLGALTLEADGLVGSGLPDITRLRPGVRVKLGPVALDGAAGYKRNGDRDGGFMTVGVTLPFRFFAD